MVKTRKEQFDTSGGNNGDTIEISGGDFSFAPNAAGGGTLAETLDGGNTTDGYNISITQGSAITVDDDLPFSITYPSAAPTSTAGESITITAQSATGPGDLDGGSVTISGGQANGSGDLGRVILTSTPISEIFSIGSTTTTLNARFGDQTGLGITDAQLSVQNTANSSPTTFSILGQNQDGTGNGDAGDIIISGGDLAGTNDGYAGSVTVNSGAIASATGTKIGGNIVLNLNTTNATVLGYVAFSENSTEYLQWVSSTPINAEPGFVSTGGTTIGRNLAIETEAGQTATNEGGFIILSTGAGNTTGVGGAIQLVTGNGGEGGGDIQLTTGSGSDASSGGGDVTINCGQGLSEGGGISLIGGRSSNAAEYATGSRIDVQGGQYDGIDALGGNTILTGGSHFGVDDGYAGNIILETGTIEKTNGYVGGGDIILNINNLNADADILGKVEFQEDDVAFASFEPGTVANFSDPVQVPSFIVSSLPSAAVAGRIIYVSDESGGAVLAFSDGSNWRIVTDRTVVS